MASVFNIQGETGRKRAWQVQVRKQARLIPAMAASVRQPLDKAYLNAATLVEHGNTSIDSAVFSTTGVMHRALLESYKRVGAVFGLDALREFEQQQKGMGEEYQRGYDNWARTHAAELVVGLNAVTRKLIKKVIAQGVAEGLTYSTIAKNIRARRKTINPVRARRIARTEVHTAANMATDTAVGATRVEFEREWSSALDERVRIEPKGGHLRANGQRRAQGTAFDVGGEKLMYPGDPKGSPGNIVNCRCTVLYHSMRDKPPARVQGGGMTTVERPSAVTGEHPQAIRLRSMLDEIKPIRPGADVNDYKVHTIRKIEEKLPEYIGKERTEKFLLVRGSMIKDWASSTTSTGAFIMKRGTERLGISGSTHYSTTYIDNIMDKVKEFKTEADKFIKDLAKRLALKEEDILDAIGLEQALNKELFKRFHKDGKIKLYRGVTSKFFGAKGEKLPKIGKKGKLVTNSLSSWTDSKNKALDFTSRQGVIFEIEAAADDVFSSFYSSGSFFSSEREFILTNKKAKKYKVIFVKDE